MCTCFVLRCNSFLSCFGALWRALCHAGLGKANQNWRVAGNKTKLLHTLSEASRWLDEANNLDF